MSFRFRHAGRDPASSGRRGLGGLYARVRGNDGKGRSARQNRELLQRNRSC